MSSSDNIVLQQQQVETNFLQQHKKIVIFLSSIWLFALAIAMFGLFTLVNPGQKIAEPRTEISTTFSQPIKSENLIGNGNFIWLFIKVLCSCAAGSLVVTYFLRNNSFSLTKEPVPSESNNNLAIEAPILAEIEEVKKKK
jgi:hypothetical protein